MIQNISKSSGCCVQTGTAIPKPYSRKLLEVAYLSAVVAGTVLGCYVSILAGSVFFIATMSCYLAFKVKYLSSHYLPAADSNKLDLLPSAPPYHPPRTLSCPLPLGRSPAAQQPRAIDEAPLAAQRAGDFSVADLNNKYAALKVRSEDVIEQLLDPKKEKTWLPNSALMLSLSHLENESLRCIYASDYEGIKDQLEADMENKSVNNLFYVTKAGALIRNHYVCVNVDVARRKVLYFDSKENYDPLICQNLSESLLPKLQTMYGNLFSLVSCVKKGVQPDTYSCGEHVVDFISRACQNSNVDPSTLSFPRVDNPIHLRKKMYQQIVRNIGQSVDKLVNELGQIELSSLTEAEQGQLVSYSALLPSFKNAVLLKDDCPLGVALNADNLAVQKVKARLRVN